MITGRFFLSARENNIILTSEYAEKGLDRFEKNELKTYGAISLMAVLLTLILFYTFTALALGIYVFPIILAMLGVIKHFKIYNTLLTGGFYKLGTTETIYKYGALLYVFFCWVSVLFIV